MEIFEKQTTEQASAFFACLPSGRIVGMKTLLNPTCLLQAGIEPMKKIAKTLKNYKNGIVNIIKYRV
ncbi:MAG: transposase, partial [Bacteroidetes bacterium]|nr:transposase [Bacteroidota bacterium]